MGLNITQKLYAIANGIIYINIKTGNFNIMYCTSCHERGYKGFKAFTLPGLFLL